MRLDNVDGFSFDFSDALDAFVFDEKDRSKPTFHGQPMKAIDIIVELLDAYLYVKIKNFHDPASYDVRMEQGSRQGCDIRPLVSLVQGRPDQRPSPVA